MHNGSDIVILIIYFDDLLIFRKNNESIDEVIRKLSKEFDMKNLGLMHYFLGIEIWQKDKGIFIS